MPPRAGTTNIELINKLYSHTSVSGNPNSYPNKYIFYSLEDSEIQQINDSELIKSLFASGSVRAYKVALIKAANHVNFSNKKPFQAYFESQDCQNRRLKGKEIDHELDFIIQRRNIEFYLRRKELESAKSELTKLVKTGANIQRSDIETRHKKRYTDYFAAFSGHVTTHLNKLQKEPRKQPEYEIFQYQDSKPRIFGRYKTFLDVENVKNGKLAALALNPQFELLNFRAPVEGRPIYQQMLQVTDGEIIKVKGASYKKRSSDNSCRFVALDPNSGEIIFRENDLDGTSQVFCFGADQREFVQKIVTEVRMLSSAPKSAPLLDPGLYPALDAFLRSGQVSSITIGEETWRVQKVRDSEGNSAIKLDGSEDKQLAVFQSDGRVITSRSFVAEGELLTFLAQVKGQCTELARLPTEFPIDNPRDVVLDLDQIAADSPDAKLAEIQKKWFSWPHFVRLQKVEVLTRGLDAASKASIMANLTDSGDLLSPGKIVQYLNEDINLTAGEDCFSVLDGGDADHPAGLDDQLLNGLIDAYTAANTVGDDSQKFNQLNSAISDFYCQFIAKLPGGFNEDETPKQLWQFISQYCSDKEVDVGLIKELQMFHLNISAMVVAQMDFEDDVTLQDQKRYIADSVQLFTMIQLATIDPSTFDSSAYHQLIAGLPEDSFMLGDDFTNANDFFADIGRRLGFNIAQVRLSEGHAHVPEDVDPLLPSTDHVAPAIASSDLPRSSSQSSLSATSLSRSSSQYSLSSTSSSEEGSTPPLSTDGKGVTFADQLSPPVTPTGQGNAPSRLSVVVSTPHHPSRDERVGVDEVAPPLQPEITNDQIKRILQYLSDENTGRKRIGKSKAGIFASEVVKTAVADIQDASGNLDISLLTADNREETLLAEYHDRSEDEEPMSQYEAIIINAKGDENLVRFGMTALAYNLLLEVRNLMHSIEQERIGSALARPMFPGQTDEELRGQFEEVGIPEEDSLSIGSQEDRGLPDIYVPTNEEALQKKVAELQQVMDDLNLHYNPNTGSASRRKGVYQTIEIFAPDAQDLPDYIQRAGDFVKAQIKSRAFQASKQSFLDYKGQKEAEFAATLDPDEEVAGLVDGPSSSERFSDELESLGGRFHGIDDIRVEDPTATELTAEKDRQLKETLPHLLKYLTTSKHLKPLQSNSVLGDRDNKVELSIVKKGRFARDSSEKTIFFNQLIESPDHPDYNNVAKTYNTLLQIASYAQNNDSRFSRLYNPNELVASLIESSSQFEYNKDAKLADLHLDQLINRTIVALKIEVKSEKFQTSMQAVENSQLVFNNEVQVEVVAAKSLVNSGTGSLLDQSHPNSFMQSLDENRANPAPETPYRGIGVKSDLVVLGAPEDSNYALQISDVFSADEDPWNNRFSGVGNIDELDGAMITQVKIEDEFVAISDIVRVNDIPGSLAVIAQLFHVQNNVEFKIVNKSGEEKEVTCDNRINKTAIYAPTPSGNDAVAGETSDFRALSQMLNREDYRDHAEQVIRGCVEKQMIAKQQEEESKRQLSGPPSPLVRSQSQESLSPDYYGLVSNV